MDESTSVSHYTRRLTLAAAICCCTVQADEPTSSDSLGGLLQNGWGNATVSEELDEELKLPTVPSLIRPLLRPIEVPPALFPSLAIEEGNIDSDASSNEVASLIPEPEVSSTLAKLIQTRSERPQNPASFSSEGVRLDLAPSVRRVDVEKQIAAAMESQAKRSEESIKVVAPIHPVVEDVGAPDGISNAESEVATSEKPATETLSLPSPADLPKVAANSVVEAPKMEEAIDASTGDEAETVTELAALPQDAVFESRKEQVAQNSDAESMASLLEAFGRPTRRELKALIPQPPEDESAQPDGQSISSLTPSETESDSEPEDRISSGELAVLPSPSQMLPNESDEAADSVSVGPTRSPANTAVEQLTQLPAPGTHLESLPLASLKPRETGLDQQTLGSSLQATRLRKLGQETLQQAFERAGRGAHHSAKKYATDALRLTIATRDAMDGGNRHAKALEAAFDAIRESEDFCGRYGAANANALSRMVSSHQTPVLKERDASTVSAYEAADAYLSYARERIVSASGEMPEASHALVLLGRLEKQVSRSSRTYTDAVTVTLHRAAIDVQPSNAAAYRALGTTLLDQGLTEQASWALQRSVEITPTRPAYEGLLEVARRSGDAVAARACTAALNHPALGSEIPVMRLNASEFASTHRPDEITTQTNGISQEPTSRQAESPRLGIRSLFPFTRR
ncbi:MAG: hypothetical protein ACR2NZ_13245 [Rubripirellula sp.]